MDLFQDQPSSTDAPSFKINKEFAERFHHNKQRAELHQLEEKYGKRQDADGSATTDTETDSSEDETEDENGEQLTPQIDAAIFRTLARIRSKSKDVYDSKVNVFEQEASNVLVASSSSSTSDPTRSKRSKEKKLTLKDYQRQRVEELIQSSDDPARELAEATTNPTPRRLDDQAQAADTLITPAREQELLRNEVLDAFHSDLAQGDDDEFFKKKSDLDQADESLGENSYRRQLLAALGEGADEGIIREALRSQIGIQPSGGAEVEEEASKGKKKKKKEKEGKGKGKEEATKSAKKAVVSREERVERENEEFLLNYILNQGWIEKDASNSRPSRPKLSAGKKRKSEEKEEEEVEGGDESDDEEEEEEEVNQGTRDWEAEAAELESEASFDSRAEAFETAYNFRFEQGEAATVVPSYARNPKDTARRADNTRKQKREERKARKEEEKRQKMQELERLKKLKRIEIVEKLKLLKEATGSSAVEMEDIDLDADFDPEEHDRKMGGKFDERYYTEEVGEEDDEGPDDMEKPTWDDDINIDDILAQEERPSKGKAKTDKRGHDDQDDRIEMDADFLEGGQGALSAAQGDRPLTKKEKKKLKKKLRAAAEKLKGSGGGKEEVEGVDLDEMDADKVKEGKDDEGFQVPKNEEERKRKAKEMMDEYYKLDYEDM
ncbi:hypothetical protein IE53DRAFT_389987, partial [Violaceomyces palustris]